MSRLSFTPRQQEVFTFVELRADWPLAKVAQELGMRVHSVRADVDRLIERELLRGRFALLNLSCVGLREELLYISVDSRDPVARARFQESALKSKHLSWLAETGGAYQYFLSLVSKEPQENAAVFYDLENRFPAISVNRRMATILEFSVFGRKYLYPKSAACCLNYRSSDSRCVIDALDAKILSVLAAPTWQSHRALAQRLRIPLSTFERRVARLEKERVIVGYVYRLDTLQLGIQNFKVLYRVHGLSKDRLQRIFEFCRRHPNVVTLTQCWGPWDGELRIEVEPGGDPARVVREFADEFAGEISSLETVPLFRFLKTDNYPLAAVI